MKEFIRENIEVGAYLMTILLVGSVLLGKCALETHKSKVQFNSAVEQMLKDGWEFERVPDYSYYATVCTDPSGHVHILGRDVIKEY